MIAETVEENNRLDPTANGPRSLSDLGGDFPPEDIEEEDLVVIPGKMVEEAYSAPHLSSEPRFSL